MKKIVVVALVLFAVAVVAQEQQQTPPAQSAGQKFTTNLIQREDAPSYSDLYCAGFLTSEKISKTNLIAGGTNSPDETLYARGNTVFVSGGGLKEGDQYSVLRELRDPNHYEPFVGQRKELLTMGQPYAELGRLRVVALRGPTAVAEVEFSCQQITLGDIVVPFKEHPPVQFRKTGTIEHFPSGPGHLNARIVMAFEFDTVVGVGQKVYLNAGANKGVKEGTYFRAVRYYDPARLSAVDNLSYKSPVGDDTQKVPGTVSPITAKNLPPRNIGEMIVLNVTQTSATAMITSAFESIQVGDWVEMEDEQ